MYKLTAGGCIRMSDGASIPQDSQNGDWAVYQDWLNQGNAPDAASAPEEPPLHLEVLTRKLLARQCTASPLWEAHNAGQISAFIDSAFPQSPDNQRLVLKYLLYTAA